MEDPFKYLIASKSLVMDRILSKVPVHDLLTLRQTGKFFKGCIDAPEFARMCIRRDFPGEECGNNASWQVYITYHQHRRAQQRAQHSQNLFFATEAGNVTLCQDLLAAGAAVNFSDCSRRDQSPIVIAVRNSHFGVVKVLLDNGANPNVWVYGGETPLKYASYLGHHGIVQSLLAAGAQVNDEYHEDRPQALHYAAQRGHYDVVATLLRHGADWSLQDGCSRNALYFALNSKATSRHATVSLLRKYMMGQ